MRRRTNSPSTSKPVRARWTLRRDPSKALLIGFLSLLVISMLQVGYWVAENLHYAASVEQRLIAEYDANADLVRDFLAGHFPESTDRLMPHLAIDASTGQVEVRASALEALEHERTARVNRYLWEGGFFIVVLAAGMAILTRTIRHDADLRRRQQNFLAAVSHEFKSPLASVRLASETLLKRAESHDTERLARRIFDDGERLLRMVDNLLDTTRLEEGRQKLSHEKLDINEAVAASIGEIKGRATAHGITMHTNIEQSLQLRMDSEAFGTILRNLLDNAVKACAAGDGTAVSVSACREGRRIKLVVGDDGLGFPSDEAAMIFEKFHRLGDELQRSMAGTGLGLYIVKRLVEMSGGVIHAASSGQGRGATLSVSWPQRSHR